MICNRIIFSSKLSRVFYWIFTTIANIFKPSYNGWATRGSRQLGTYKDINPYDNIDQDYYCEGSINSQKYISNKS